jgi:enolase
MKRSMSWMLIDDPVKDMAIGLEVPLVKCGAPRSGERISFLNTLLRGADEFPQARFRSLYTLGRPN